IFGVLELLVSVACRRLFGGRLAFGGGEKFLQKHEWLQPCLSLRTEAPIKPSPGPAQGRFLRFCCIETEECAVERRRSASSSCSAAVHAPEWIPWPTKRSPSRTSASNTLSPSRVRV